MQTRHTAPASTARILPLVVILTVLWGTNWALFPIALREISVWTFRSICLLGSGLFLLGLAQLRGIPLGVPRGQRAGLVMAALAYLVVWNVASTYAAILMPSGQAAVLGYTMPLWATLLSWLVLGDKPTPRLLGSMVLAIGGVGCLVLAARHSAATSPLGFILALMAGIGWAAGTVLLKRAGLTVPPIVSTGWQLLIAGVPITCIALALGSRQEAFMPSITSVLVIAYITVVPMALGNIAWFSIVDAVPASISGLCTVMVPMVAMVTGALVHGEPLGALEIAAMACCAAALLLVLLRPDSAKAPPRPVRGA